MADDERCPGCGARCDYVTAQRECGACYGPVTPIDQRSDAGATERTLWVHACVGHARIWFGGPYQRIGTAASAAAGRTT